MSEGAEMMQLDPNGSCPNCGGERGEHFKDCPRKTDGADEFVPVLQAPELIAAPRKGRMTVVETVYHQSPESPAVAFSSNFVRMLDSDEVPHSRTMKVDALWRSLELGWLDGKDGKTVAGMLVISNEDGKSQFPQGVKLIKLQDPQTETLKRVVEVGFRDGDQGFAPRLEIWPGESARFQLSNSGDAVIRCLQGQIRVTVSAVPR